MGVQFTDKANQPMVFALLRPVGPCVIVWLKRALDSRMDSMNGQHGNGNLGAKPDSQAGVLSVLLSILASKRAVLDRQHGRNRLGLGSVSPMDSAK